MAYITDFKIYTKHSPDAKPIVNFMDESRFDIHAAGKKLRDKNKMKFNFFLKKKSFTCIWVKKIGDNHFSFRKSL